MEIAQARPRRRPRPPMAHPVSEAAQRHVRLRLVSCRCPDAPCQLHPFAFDCERLLEAPMAH